MTFILFMMRYYVAIRSQYVLAEQARINPVTPENMIEYLRQLQTTTQSRFWTTPANSESVSGSPGNTGSSAEPQIPGFLASPISRRFSWLKGQLRPPKAEVRNGPGQSTSESEEVSSSFASSDIPAIIETNSCSQSVSAGSMGRLLRGLDHDEQIVLLVERKRRRARILRYFLLDSFYAWVLVIYALVLVGYIALLSTLFTRLKLSTIYYNCFSGPEYLPHVVITGIFNVVIGPLFGVVIWRYQDAYGIRNSLCFAFVLGVLFWSGALTWRLISSWHDKQISASIIYVGQIVFTHSLFITQPLVKSIRLAQAQRRNAGSSRQEPVQDLEQHLATRCKSALDGVSRQSLLFALQDSAEHEGIRRFAEICFCIEMVTFLDVYQAFKKCALQVMQDSQANEALSGNQEHCESSDFAIPSAAPSIVVTESINPAHEGSEGHFESPADSNIFSYSAISHSTTRHSHRGHSCEPARSPRLLSRHNLPSMLVSGRDHADSSRTRLSRAKKQWTEVNEKNIQRFSVGIVDMLRQAFPSSGVDKSTAVAEHLRPKLCEILKTFILPDSPLELNVDARIVLSAKNYIKGGGSFSYHEIDEIKEVVIDLLYSNVYVRFRQSGLQK
ncbi:hypothetical protein LPJ56_000554 [Coemansia sp. RSA 2599]|nr:hypothetical protein LPJ56_000554 [Coemansia sp. RSA 2599]